METPRREAVSVSTQKHPFSTEVASADDSIRGCNLAETPFRTAVDVCPYGMVMTDETGSITMLNAEIERLFGYDREELLGKSIEILVPERFRDSHLRYRTGFMENPGSREMGSGMDLLGVRKDGSEFSVEVGLRPIRTKDGLFVLSAVVDITDRKKVEQELRESRDLLERRVEERTRELAKANDILTRNSEALRRSNDELRQFAYVASHDLQEPLRAVGGCMELLAETFKGKLGADADELIRHAVDGANRMRELILDLLDYSRVDTRGKPFETVDLTCVMNEVMENLAVALNESHAEWTYRELPVVYADRGQMVSLFQNLIGNAIKFRGKDRPRVEITITQEHEEWLFKVKDNGIGIDPKYFPRLFVLFQRLHTRDKYPGTGIGLAICKKIVERHAGRIWVESALGAGTTFLFTLPTGTHKNDTIETPH